VILFLSTEQIDGLLDARHVENKSTLKKSGINMHTKTMPESEGKFTKEGIAGELFCPKCKRNGTIRWKTWDSSCGDYTDTKYICTACHHYWWADGADA